LLAMQSTMNYFASHISRHSARLEWIRICFNFCVDAFFFYFCSRVSTQSRNRRIRSALLVCRQALLPRTRSVFCKILLTSSQLLTCFLSNKNSTQDFKFFIPKVKMQTHLLISTTINFLLMKLIFEPYDENHR
jgi:hypothetical protein